jgi:hypothetical protein
MRSDRNAVSQLMKLTLHCKYCLIFRNFFDVLMPLLQNIGDYQAMFIFRTVAKKI